MTSESRFLDSGIVTRELAQMIAPSRTALLVIDAQVDFLSPSGVAALGGADVRSCEPALEQVRSLVGAARKSGVTLAFARVVTRPQTDSKSLKNFHARKGHPAESLAICRAGTPGADYYRVSPQAGDIEIEKPLYSSFVGTDLDARLRARGVDTLVVAGFTTDCCVDSTVRDAFHRDYDVFVVADACASYEKALHDNVLDALSRHCALLTETHTVLKAWS